MNTDKATQLKNITMIGQWNTSSMNENTMLTHF